MKAARINTIPSRVFGFVSLLLVLSLFVLFGTGCKENKPAPQQAPAAAPNETNTMFQKLNQGPTLPKPPADKEDDPAPKAPAPELLPGLMLEESPECKAFSAEQKQVRDQVAQLRQEQVAPAAAKAETARKAFEECQDDVGCVNNIERYESKNRAYQNAKRALEDAETKVEDLETQLYQISQKIAAKCDTNPL